MITLDLSNPFEFTLKDQFGNTKTVSGTFRELTKKEHDDFKKKNKTLEASAREGEGFVKKINHTKKLINLREKSGEYNVAANLMADLEAIERDFDAFSSSFDPVKERNDVLRARFNLCLGGDDRTEILEIAELYGFDRVLETILKAISEDKAGK
jgi:hypothetical protein